MYICDGTTEWDHIQLFPLYKCPMFNCIFVNSATLFYIVKEKKDAPIGIKLKRRIINALLDAMEAHIGDDTMMRNGCLTLCQFKIPTDVVSTYA